MEVRRSARRLVAQSGQETEWPELNQVPVEISRYVQGQSMRKI